MRKNILTKLICGIALLVFFASCKAKKQLLPATLIPKVMAEELKSDLAKIAKINKLKKWSTIYENVV
jgi:hypothetical protein